MRCLNSFNRPRNRRNLRRWDSVVRDDPTIRVFSSGLASVFCAIERSPWVSEKCQVLWFVYVGREKKKIQLNGVIFERHHPWRRLR